MNVRAYLTFYWNRPFSFFFSSEIDQCSFPLNAHCIVSLFCLFCCVSSLFCSTLVCVLRALIAISDCFVILLC